MENRKKIIIIGGASVLVLAIVLAIVFYRKRKKAAAATTTKQMEAIVNALGDVLTHKTTIPINADNTNSNVKNTTPGVAIVTNSVHGLAFNPGNFIAPTVKTTGIGALQSKDSVYQKIYINRKDRNDIVTGCYILLSYMPINIAVNPDCDFAKRYKNSGVQIPANLFAVGGNPDRARLMARLLACTTQLNGTVLTSINPIEDITTSVGLDGFMNNIFDQICSDFTSPSGRANSFNYTPGTLPTFNYNNPLWAVADNKTGDDTLLQLFQDIVNEFIPQINQNIKRLNSVYDINFFVEKCNNMFPTLENLSNVVPNAVTPKQRGGIAAGSASPATPIYTLFATKAAGLAVLDRWVRQAVVYQNVVLFDQTGRVGGWSRVRAQICYDLGFKQVSFTDMSTYVNGALNANVTDNPPTLLPFFDDRQAIRLLNYVQPVVAPTAAQLAQAQAKADSEVAQQNAIEMTIAKTLISIII